ncbi:MAG: DUF1206 domain-containing protein, partial [Candidatus Nanopelagicales bacterium]
MSAQHSATSNSTTSNSTTSTAGATAQRASDSPWVKATARIGLAARGLVYILVGYIAIHIAFGTTSTQATQQGAFQTVARQPFGEVVLWVMVVGFLGYAVWRFIEAYTGPSTETDDKKRNALRVVSAIRGIVYLGFAYGAAHIAITSHSKSTASTAAGIMKSTGGQLLVGAIGVALIVAGIAMVIQGWRVDFEKELDTGRMGTTTRSVVEKLGRFGYIARGIVFGLAGYFVVQAAVNFNPKEANGLDVALRSVAQASYGTFLLLLIALGLIAFGLYS